MFKVTFAFEDGSVTETYANTGDNLLEIAREANVAIDAPCSGNGACGKCRVQLKSGELETKKTLHISDEEFEEGWRLACMSKIIADVEILVPDIASAYKSRMKVADLSSREEIAIFENAKREIELAGIELKNSLDVVEVQMEEPTLDDTMPDIERLSRALRKFMNLKRVRIPYTVLRKLPDVLRNSKFSVKCVLRTTPDDMFVYDIFDSREDVVIGGLAVDIGTTTVSAVLINMETGEILAKSSAGNGQIRYGADVINRIIEAAKPGATYSDIHHACMRVIAERLHDWGILPVDVEESLSPEGQQHRRWLACGVAHHLGLDVHDCAQARYESYQGAKITPGMVFTIEPGLYFREDDLMIPPEYRGIGIRIEDDVLMTEDGPEWISAGIPKQIDDVEAWIAQMAAEGAKDAR